MVPPRTIDSHSESYRLLNALILVIQLTFV
jgi:hypothetical protein